MTPLRQHMIDAMTVRNLAKLTQQAYLNAVAGLANYYRRAPDAITDQEVQAYLLYLVRERQLAWSTVNADIPHPWDEF